MDAPEVVAVVTADAWGVVVVTLLAQAIVIAYALLVITDAAAVMVVEAIVELDALLVVKDALALAKDVLGALDVEDRARQIARRRVKDQHAHHVMAALDALVRVHLVVVVVDALRVVMGAPDVVADAGPLVLAV